MLASLSVLMIGCAGKPTKEQLNGVGIALVPPIDMTYSAAYSRSANIHFATGENDSIARRIRISAGNTLDSIPNELAKAIVQQLDVAGVKAHIVPYATIDEKQQHSYANVSSKYVLECVPSFLFHGPQLTLISYYAHCKLFQNGTAIVHVQAIGFGFPSQVTLGPAIQSESPNYPIPLGFDAIAPSLHEKVPNIARGIVRHLLVQ